MPGGRDGPSVVSYEAIDQAVAESVEHFSAQVEQARNLLLGMLSHDMRNPLHTVRMTALHLGQMNAGADVSAAAGRLIRSGAKGHGGAAEARSDDRETVFTVRLPRGRS